MAQSLAPYNNSMRLGQGFNSYTQQICLDQAVSRDMSKAIKAKESITVGSVFGSGNGDKDSDKKALKQGSDDEGPDENTPEENKPQAKSSLTVMPWVKPQIVTYSSRFVDKLSDVTDAMNISGSLSIKTATIGGKANGSYVDSDKFKSSDINFHLQVKVTNQIHDAADYNIFHKLDNVSAKEFPEVYGDCFISGWEEGGELNAVLSVKVHDKAKVFEIKAGLEAELNTATISGEVKADFGMEKNSLNKSTETTISVTWSGGGSIKDPTEDWTIQSLKKAAAAFPELVAITPQRTYAILTKYTSLASFHKQKTDFSPLDYESAGIYTRALLDHYMDYKSLWKQISHATYELKGNRATIETSKIGQDMIELATIYEMPVDKIAEKAAAKAAAGQSVELQIAPASSQALAIVDAPGLDAIANSQGQPIKAGSTTPTVMTKETPEASRITFAPFKANFAGLIHARKVCRFEMAKIVKEVDLVAKEPLLSTDAIRDGYFLNPLVFEQLLPVVRSLSAENAKRRVRDPNAALLLGYIPPVEEHDALPPVFKLEHSISEYALVLQTSVAELAGKAPEYLMQGCAGLYSKKVPSVAKWNNDLESLDATFRPSRISVWVVGQVVHGIQMSYSKDEHKSHGTCTGDPSHIWNLADDGSEIITEVVVRQDEKEVNGSKRPFIRSIAFATSDCNVWDTAVKLDKQEVATTSETKADALTITGTCTWVCPEDGRWSLRGFFSFKAASEPDAAEVPCMLGVVWGKDVFVPLPNATISPPLCKNFLGLGHDLQGNILRFKKLPNYSTFNDKFLMGESVTTGANNYDTAKAFNALNSIDVNWKIAKIAFASKNSRLTGLLVTYTNGETAKHGDFDKNEVWSCEVHSDLVVAKITAGRVAGKPQGPAYVDTVEFIRADDNGRQSAWPLNVSTLRYLGEGTTRVSGEGLSQVVEQAPRMGDNSKWTIRGFYGEHDDVSITRLGVIWGRG
ncbi:hypothetical protein B0J13DRAFT_596179 [Dactylonectria estremocensis]|uniref:Jacalin-type lectin domain-containing protein n=1 Tax=Dactylonectria estremocensis TaxID=1079267 RepID=A0A9P9ER04_9HYPO|nr:hypothetical protein B0J13DRAFT_596179 [Dactylonectria estremocensis]